MLFQPPFTQEEARKQLEDIEVRARAIETIVKEHQEKLGKPKEVKELLGWVAQIVRDIDRMADHVKKHLNDL